MSRSTPFGAKHTGRQTIQFRCSFVYSVSAHAPTSGFCRLHRLRCARRRGNFGCRRSTHRFRYGRKPLYSRRTDFPRRSPPRDFHCDCRHARQPIRHPFLKADDTETLGSAPGVPPAYHYDHGRGSRRVAHSRQTPFSFCADRVRGRGVPRIPLERFAYCHPQNGGGRYGRAFRRSCVCRAQREHHRNTCRYAG